MTTTAADLVAEARRYVMAAGRPVLNRLTTTMDASVTTMALDFPAGAVGPGSVLAVDLELCYVWSTAGTTATVQRAHGGSTAAAHTAGALVTVNPLVSDFSIFAELNNDLAALSSPMTGLFRVRTVSRTMTTAASYDLSADATSVQSVQWNDYGPYLDWPTIDRWDILFNQDTTVFPSGVALRLYTPPPPGRTLRIAYAAAFGTLTALTDDVQAVTGLPASANDIPVLGAAARLLTAREARRSSLDAQPESRQATDVPAGTARSAAAGLFALRKQRINEEAARLTSSYPSIMRPAV